MNKTVQKGDVITIIPDQGPGSDKLVVHVEEHIITMADIEVKEDMFTEAELKRAHKDLWGYDNTTVERTVAQARKNRAYDKEQR